MNIISNHQTPWTVYRDPTSNLVYFVHSKCACSFYKKLYQTLGWNVETTAQVNWNKDYVFSYIRNPLIKHRMGIIEWFYFNNRLELLKDNFNNSDFFRMISEVAYLDFHSLSLYEHLGDKMFQVKWIPIDVPEINHRQQTVDLIKLKSSISPNIEEWFLNLPPIHVSTGFKRDCINQLLTYEPTPLIIKSIEQDQCLYDTVITAPGFEPMGYAVRIQQLLDTGMTQAQAEQIADQEVSDLTYLNWK